MDIALTIIKYKHSSNPLIDFFNYEPLSQLMQGAGMAVLTLLISFAIGIFINHLDNRERKGSFLDLHVALDYVWRFKYSVVLLLLVEIVPFFMGVNNIWLQVFFFTIWIVALVGLIRILFRLYEWVKGDKNNSRIKYLSDFPKSKRDKIVSWLDLWSTDTNLDNRFNEKDFFIPFSEEIDSLIKSEDKDDLNLLSKLLEGYLSNIEKRNKTFLIVFPEFFPKVLEWHFILWKKQYSEFSKEKTERPYSNHHLFETDHVIDQIIKFVTKEALIGDNAHPFSYFKALEVHIEMYQNVTIEGKEHIYSYLDQMPIYEDCFNMIPLSQNSYEIWGHYFPDDWKIKISNLEKNKISNIWYSRFLDWSQSRIHNNKTEWDKEMEELSKELFTSVDPITWAKIYTFVIRPWSNSRIKSVIEKRVNFGYAGRFISSWGDDDESNFSKIYEVELETTFDLAMYLFGNRVFTKDNLNKWIEELDTLNYEEDTDEFRRKQVWKSIFLALKKRIKNS